MVTYALLNYYEDNHFLIGIGVTLLSMIALAGIFMVIPDLMVNTGRTLGFDAESGPISDTLGGTLGPIIGLIAAILTHL